MATDRPIHDAAQCHELARHLAHDVKNALAGIAGVLDIVGRDLPAGSPGREVMPDVKQEIERIKTLLAEFVEKTRGVE